MTEFKPIETQEAFDDAVKTRLERQAKKYEGFLSPDDVQKLKDSYTGYTSPSELETLKQGHQKELDSLNAQIKELTGSNNQLKEANQNYQHEKLKYDVAHKFGIPREMASRLNGTDEESLKKDAENFSQFVSKKQTLPLGSNEPSVDDKNQMYRQLASQLKGDYNMATKTESKNYFNPQLVSDVFSKVKGHSALANLSGQTPIPFSGTEQFVFSMDGEASIVGEGQNKPSGEAGWDKVVIRPIKFVYQHRLTDEFVNMAEEQQIPYLAQFSDGFAKKIARALDISAFHGVNPADGQDSDAIGNNAFDKAVTQTVTYKADEADENIDDAIALIQANDGDVTGIAVSPSMGSALGKIKNGLGASVYPEYRFGGKPSSFGSLNADVNKTVEFKQNKDRAIVGDFANAFKWGFAENVPMEIIQYGDPDGQGDLKRTNEIVLRAEAYIGWGILDASSFTRIVEE